MTDLARNTRTLIVCFSVALLALAPLRFVEAGQQALIMEQSQVLGESVEVRVVVPTVKEINPAQLQSPYDEIDRNLGGDDCLMEEEARGLVEEVTLGLVKGAYTEMEVRDVLEEVGEIEKRLCK